MHAGAPWVVTTPDTSFSAAINPASGPQSGGTLLRITTPGAFPAESVTCSFAGMHVPGTLALSGTTRPRSAADLLPALVVSCVTPELPSASQVMVTVRLTPYCFDSQLILASCSEVGTWLRVSDLKRDAPFLCLAATPSFALTFSGFDGLLCLHRQHEQ